MIDLSPEAESLAKRLAAAQSLSIGEAVMLALEEKARATGMLAACSRPRRRMSVAEILAVGADIAAMPLLESRSPNDIMDDIDAL